MSSEIYGDSIPDFQALTESIKATGDNISGAKARLEKCTKKRFGKINDLSQPQIRRREVKIEEQQKALKRKILDAKIFFSE